MLLCVLVCENAQDYEHFMISLDTIFFLVVVVSTFVCVFYFIWMSRTVIEGVLRDVDEFWNFNVSNEFKFHNFNIIHLFLLQRYFQIQFLPINRATRIGLRMISRFMLFQPLVCLNSIEEKATFYLLLKKKLSKCYSQSPSIFILLNDSIQFIIMISW